jgi:hypothetical protein
MVNTEGSEYPRTAVLISEFETFITEFFVRFKKEITDDCYKALESVCKRRRTQSTSNTACDPVDLTRIVADYVDTACDPVDQAIT